MDIKKVPLVFTWCIKSYFFMSVVSVEVILIAEALLINMSIPPNLFTVYSIALFICSSNLTSQTIGRA